MKYTSVLDASEQSFQNLINDAEDFENDKIFASIRSRDYDESDINLINAEVRISIAKIDKEYISLEKFSKEFNKLYATDHNQCYDTALKLCRKLRSTLAGTKKLFRKMCPIIRKKAGGNGTEKKLSVFNHSYLTGLTFSRDMFGLESYPDCVKDLCCSVSLFFCKLTGVMALCREIIAKENYIRCHPDLCYKIYKDNYDNVAKKSRDTIKFIENNSGITYQMNSLKERMDKAKSLQQVICDCFHTYNESQFQKFVIFDTIISLGIGWDYGKRSQWETHLLFGIVPKYDSDEVKMTITLKENFIPWRKDWGKGWQFEPLECTLYLNTVLGHDFWTKQPTKYESGYYPFSTRIRPNLGFGERFTYQIPNNRRKRVKSLTLFYELSTNDIYFMRFYRNGNAGFWDVFGLSFGAKMQIL